jgi:hypothetical protein
LLLLDFLSELPSFLGLLQITSVPANHLQSFETHRMVVIVTQWLSYYAYCRVQRRGAFLWSDAAMPHASVAMRSSVDDPPTAGKNQKVFNGQI